MSDAVVDFPDHFSSLAEDYARFRPQYPAALFDRIASEAPSRSTSWDCATGNGQAAVALAERFREVVATDASAQQIANAAPHPRIRYGVEPAERTTLPDQHVDAVVVGAALHWLDHRVFFEEVGRVAKPGAVFAAFTYTTHIELTPTIDAVVHRYTDEVLADHWTRHIQLVRDGYQSIDIPFAELNPPALSIVESWSFERTLGVLGTWSAAGRYRAVTGNAATDEIREDLARAWMESAPIDQPLQVTLPLAIRMARIS